MTTFDTIYQNIIKKIMEEGIEELNERTGHKIKILPGVSFQIDVEKEGFPLLTLRKNPIKSPIAEQVWFITGDKDTAFLPIALISYYIYTGIGYLISSKTWVSKSLCNIFY